MYCCFCRNMMIWQNDFDFEDYGIDKAGIVSVYECINCKNVSENYLCLEDEEE